MNHLFLNRTYIIRCTLFRKNIFISARILAGLEIPEDDIHPIGVRQSRRLAQIKIKEQAEPSKPEPKPEKVNKKKIELVSGFALIVKKCS